MCDPTGQSEKYNVWLCKWEGGAYNTSAMVMRDIGSFHCPEPMFISRGAAEGNKHGLGAMETAYIPHNHILTV